MAATDASLHDTIDSARVDMAQHGYERDGSVPLNNFWRDAQGADPWTKADLKGAMSS